MKCCFLRTAAFLATLTPEFSPRYRVGGQAGWLLRVFGCGWPALNFHRTARYCRRSLFQQRHARAFQNRSDSALAPATKPGALRCINDTTKSPNSAEFTQDGQGRRFSRSPMASERRGPRRFGCGPGFSKSSDSPRRADVIAFVPVVPADGTSKSN